MSEHEFDFYLSLLGSLLRLSPAQRAQIADELRDHLEQRLEELTRAGLSRQAAIHSALAEFGDAAGLALHFTHIARQKTRRLVMRCTIGTVAAAAAVLIVGSFFWPEAQVQGPAWVVAQQPAVKKDKLATVPGGDRMQAEVESKLAQRLPKLEFVEAPFLEAVEFISDSIGVDVLLDRKRFEEQGVMLDTPVTLQIKHTAVAARTALELLLEQIGGQALGYTIRDGVIYLTQKYQADEIQVYNCRDLLQGEAGHDLDPFGSGGGSTPMGGAAGGPAARFGGAPDGSAPPGMMSGGLGGGGLGGGSFGGGVMATPRSLLLQVIVSTIHPDTWTDTGGQGSISEFNGLLIVKHSQSVHREIKQVLAMMREAAAEAPGKQR